jgi:hypothetical protein
MARPIALLIAVLVAVALTLASDVPVRADGGESPAVARRRPVVVGTLAVRAADIVAVFRPAQQQAVVVYVGRVGHAIQPIVFNDAREATAVFDGLWNNKDVTKDPGDDDALRPLTRMMPKDKDAAGGEDRNTATLILNVDRVLAINYDANERACRIYLDKLTTEPIGPQDNQYIDIRSSRDEADKVVAAYKACLYTK